VKPRLVKPSPNNSADGEEEPQYYDTEFYVPEARDPNTHASEKLTLRLPPYYMDQMAAISNSRIFPNLDSVSAVGRWMVHDGLRKLAKMRPDVITFMPQLEAIRELAAEQKRYRDFETIIKAATEEINQLVLAGMPNQARQLLYKVERQIISMPDGEWRNRYLRKIREKFGDLRKSRARVDLTDVEVDDVVGPSWED